MDAYFDQLTGTLLSIRNKHEMSEFLKSILTPAEVAEIPTRLEIIRLLKQGVPQHTIAKKLGVGIATVTRGSKELALGHFKNVDASWRPSGTGG